MPIPNLELSGLLPPLLTEGEFASGFSPYRCTLGEVCERFGTSDERKKILKGLLELRHEYRSRGIKGFQWLAGSFLEDIEVLEDRPPNDIDVATFISAPTERTGLESLKNSFPELFDRKTVKAKYGVDQLFLHLRSPASRIVATSNYWYALYTHRKGREWKGILRVELNITDDDSTLNEILTSK